MRIMDCVLLLFQKKVDTVTQDPEKPCPKPSWGESLKVSFTHSKTFLVNVLKFRTLLFISSATNKLLVIRAGIVRLANREDPDQTASSEAV